MTSPLYINQTCGVFRRLSPLKHLYFQESQTIVSHLIINFWKFFYPFLTPNPPSSPQPSSSPQPPFLSPALQFSPQPPIINSSQRLYLPVIPRIEQFSLHCGLNFAQSGAHYQERDCKLHSVISTVTVSIYGFRFPAKSSYHDDCHKSGKYGGQTIGTVHDLLG